MAEAHALQKEYIKAEKILNTAEKIFPGDKFLFEKKIAIHKQSKENERRKKNKFKKMFAKK